MAKQGSKKVHHRPERRRTAGFGWRPDLPDARDHYFSVLPSTLKKLPALDYQAI
ncbi:MAG: hypothetical protein OEW08_11985 [Gammaproteobacteria bacterium]|nr:hypothetical protein [Gammaproteobacteria bacterium]